MKYYDLRKKEYVVYDDDSKALSFFYDNIFGRVLLKVLISGFVRKPYNYYMSTKLSLKKVNKFIKQNNINMDEYEKENYKSFNDFFIRKIKSDRRPIANGLFAIADSKLSVYKIDNNLSFKVKNSIYTVEELLGENRFNFDGGYALIFRLCVDDYHHYVYPDDGEILYNKRINGKLHTVQPLAFKKYKVFSENTREITLLKTKHYGKVAYIEVGAMMIGKIVNENVTNFKRGSEKGHFEFGGSTCILLFEKDKIKINELIVENTKKDIETIVKLGDSLE